MTGLEFVSFLITRKQCEDTDQARAIGQRFINSHILVPVYYDPDDSETPVFEGQSELYYVDDSILEVLGVERMLTCRAEMGDIPQEVVQPQKEHNKILRMSGYLLTISGAQGGVAEQDAPAQ